MAHGDRNHWLEHLPLVLLGVRAALKPDLACSSAELVFGTPLCLPADVFAPTPSSDLDPPDFVRRLRKAFSTLKPVPTRAMCSRTCFTSPDLTTTSHVFLRTDALRRSLVPPYTGPYKVISRNSKTFTIQVGTRQETVSIDRLKPAFCESQCASSCMVSQLPPAPPPTPKHVTWAEPPAQPLQRRQPM